MMKRDITLNDNGSRLGKIIIYIFILIVAFICVMPVIWVLWFSLKTNAEIYTNPFGVPAGLTLENHIYAWKAGRFGPAILNTIVVGITATLLSVLIGSMASFAISRMKWKHANIVMNYFMIGLVIPVQCILLPLYLQNIMPGFSNSLWGLILTYLAFSLPITILIMTGCFNSIPDEVIYLACIDGCSVYRIYSGIFLPISKNGLLASAMIVFALCWNDLPVSIALISDENNYTLQVALSRFVRPYNTNYTLMIAAAAIAIIPSIVVYAVFSKEITDSLEYLTDDGQIKRICK